MLVGLKCFPLDGDDALPLDREFCCCRWGLFRSLLLAAAAATAAAPVPPSGELDDATTACCSLDAAADPNSNEAMESMPPLPLVAEAEAARAAAREEGEVLPRTSPMAREYRAAKEEEDAPPTRAARPEAALRSPPTSANLSKREETPSLSRAAVERETLRLRGGRPTPVVVVSPAVAVVPLLEDLARAVRDDAAAAGDDRSRDNLGVAPAVLAAVPAVPALLRLRPWGEFRDEEFAPPPAPKDTTVAPRLAEAALFAAETNTGTLASVTTTNAPAGSTIRPNVETHRSIPLALARTRSACGGGRSEVCLADMDAEDADERWDEEEPPPPPPAEEEAELPEAEEEWAEGEVAARRTSWAAMRHARGENPPS